MMAARRRIDLNGALALVTGAGRGIGRAVALRLAREGARVVCVDIAAESAAKTALACHEAGGQAGSYAADVASADAMAQLAAEVERHHGTPDVLVNNAGVGMSGRFTDMTLQDWAWIRSINLDGVIHGCHVFGPAMLARGRGHVVNISSGLGYTPTATEPAYVTTKAGVLALSQCLRADWRRQGVGVSAVCPGVINTPIVDHTRFLGAQASAVHDRAERLFRRGHPAGTVANAVVDAVRRDRAVVPVGLEAWAGWLLHRWAPVAVQQAIAAQTRFGPRP